MLDFDTASGSSIAQYWLLSIYLKKKDLSAAQVDSSDTIFPIHYVIGRSLQRLWTKVHEGGYCAEDFARLAIFFQREMTKISAWDCFKKICYEVVALINGHS